MEIARHWRLKAQRYQLEGSICPDCGQVSFPPRPVCLDCIALADRIGSSEFSKLPAANHLSDAKSLKGG